MHRGTAILGLVSVLALGWLASCGSPVEGAWEGKKSLAQGSDPSGYEIHLTLSRFVKDEPGGAVEYTIFHLDGRMDVCKSALRCKEKTGETYQYEESITHGKCEDGLTIRASSISEEALSFQRLGADGGAEMEVDLSVQTGIPTAKGRPTG